MAWRLGLPLFCRSWREEIWMIFLNPSCKPGSFVRFLSVWSLSWVWELHFKPGNFQTVPIVYWSGLCTSSPWNPMHDNLRKMQGYLNPWVWRCAYTAIAVSLATECDSCFLLTRSNRMSPSPILSTRFSTNYHLPNLVAAAVGELESRFPLVPPIFFFFHWSWKVQVTRCLS